MKKDINNPELSVGQVLDGFKIEKIDYLPKLSNTMYQLLHKKSGAKLIHLSNDDDNNCFGIAFRTTPKDSTGVAHILEHNALCGSKHFPIRDPFFSMIKRSMQTFMNAFTASDWTMYPFSSQNETDFYNLMKIYLDAAFFPKLTELNFKQEGHRLEFEEIENPNSPLTYKGVVYNEMLGAMASPGQVMSYGLGKALFPTVTYRYNSGGDPEEIIKLTHKQLIEFHKRHYHPSNSFFYTYGDIPLTKHLKQINKLALSEFNRIEVDTFVPDEQRFDAPKSLSLSYPLSKAEDDGKKCRIALAWLTANIKDSLDILTLQIINLILLGHSGSPLKRVLLESNLGKGLTDSTGLEDEIKEAFFSVGLQGVAEKDLDQVEQLILSTLRNIVDEGISQDQIESAIHRLELDTREISGEHYPYGLNLLFRFFGAWIHGGDPVKSIDFDRKMELLQTKMREPRYFENQIKSYLIDNPHRVKVVLKPDFELEKQREGSLTKKLARLKTQMSEKGIQKILVDSKNLRILQEQEEDLSCLPRLCLEDIPKQAKFLDYLPKGNSKTDTSYYERPTNGILYHTFYFKYQSLKQEDREWMPVLMSLLTNVGADGLGYEEMAGLVNRYTGGFSANISIEKHINGDLKDYLSLSGKSLAKNIGKFFEIAKKFLTAWDFSDLDRIQTLIAQRANALLNSVVQAGHNYAINLASRGFSHACATVEVYGGIHQVRFMQKLVNMSQKELKEELTRLSQTLKSLFTPQNISVLVVGEKEHFESSEHNIDTFISALRKNNSSSPKKVTSASNPKIIELSYQREACMITTPVSYVAQCYKTANYEHDDSPILLVLATLIKSCFLHAEIREKGGAYGAMTGYNSDEGVFAFVSYRDPHFGRTMQVYDQVVPWLKDQKFTQQNVEEAILQTCSKLDTPLSPAGKALNEYIIQRKGKTKNIRNNYRKRILECTKEDLIRVGLKHLNTKPSISAITGNEIINRDKEILDANPIETFTI